MSSEVDVNVTCSRDFKCDDALNMAAIPSSDMCEIARDVRPAKDGSDERIAAIVSPALMQCFNSMSSERSGDGGREATTLEVNLDVKSCSIDLAVPDIIQSNIWSWHVVLNCNFNMFEVGSNRRRENVLDTAARDTFRSGFERHIIKGLQAGRWAEQGCYSLMSEIENNFRHDKHGIDDRMEAIVSPASWLRLSSSSMSRARIGAGLEGRDAILCGVNIDSKSLADDTP